MKKYINTKIFFAVLLTFLSFFSNATDKEVKILTKEECKKYNIKPMILPDGEVLMPRHDGKTYFIDYSLNPNIAQEQPTAYAIDKAIEKGNIIDINGDSDIGLILNNSAKILPLTLRLNGGEGQNAGEEVQYNISLLSLIFTTSGVKVAVGVRFIFPGQDGDTPKNIYLGAILDVNKKGGTFGGDLKFIDVGKIFENAMLGSKIFFELGPQTAIHFNCGKVVGFTLDGLISLDRSIALPEDSNGKVIPGNVNFLFKTLLGSKSNAGSKLIGAWKNFMLELNFANAYGFHLNGAPDIGFRSLSSNASSNNIVLDLSANANPANASSINCSEINLTEPGWKGIFIQNLGVRLPEIFKSKTGAPLNLNIERMAICKAGFYSNFTLNRKHPDSLISTSEGRIGDGWDFSINEIGLEVCQFEIKKFQIGGRTRIPIMREGEALTYSYSKNLNSSDYSFSMGAVGDYHFDVLVGTAHICAVRAVINKTGGKNHIDAFLDGAITLSNDEDDLSLGVGFKNMKMTSKFPFVEKGTLVIGGNCNTNQPTSDERKKSVNYFGFDVEIGDLEVGTLTDGMFTGTATASVNLDEIIDAKGKFYVEGKLAEAGGTFKMSNIKKIKIEALKVQADFKVFGIDGYVERIEDKERGIKGIGGGVDFSLRMSSGDLQSAGKVAIVFGKNRIEDYKFWYFDASVNLATIMPTTKGLPIGVVTLKGITGGGYKNMKVSYNSSSISGLTFAPQKGQWGFRVGTIFGLKGDVASLAGLLEMKGETGKGIKRVSLFADLEALLDDENAPVPDLEMVKAQMGAASRVADNLIAPAQIDNNNYKTEASNNALYINEATNAFKPKIKDPDRVVIVGASTLFTYDVDASTFLGLIIPNIYIKERDASLTSSGIGIVKISPDEWYVHLGKQAWSERIGLTFNAYDNLKASANAYLMLGHGIGGLPTPQVPDAFKALFSSAKNISQSEIESERKKSENIDEYNGLKDGKGFAFGAAIDVSVGLTLGRIVNATIKAGAGVDAVILNKKACPTYIGWDGGNGKNWSASARLYGYFMGDLKILTVNLAQFGAGFALQATIPKPVTAEGRVVVFAKIWKSKMELNIKVKIGENCPTPPTPPKIITYKFIEKTYPAKDETNVPITSNIRLQLFKSEDQTNQTEILKHKTKLSLFSVVDGIQTEIYTIEKNNDGTSLDDLSFSPSVILPKNTIIKVVATVQLLDKDGPIIDDDGNLLIEKDYTYTFKTSNKDLALARPDVKAYPLIDQYNVYPSDYPANIKIDPAVLLKLQAACEDCKFQAIIKAKSPTTGNEITKDFTINPNLTFDISALTAKGIYNLQICAIRESGEKEILYDKHYFRISNYKTFADKIDYFNNTNQLASTYDEDGIPYLELSSNSTEVFEGFSKEEISTMTSIRSKDYVAVGTDNWFKWYNRKFDQNYNSNSFWNDNEFNKIATYKQPYYPYLLNGDMVQGNSGTVSRPIWYYRPFDTSLIKYITVFDKCIEGKNIGTSGYDPERTVCPTIKNFPTNSPNGYCIIVDYDPLKNTNIIDNYQPKNNNCIKILPERDIFLFLKKPSKTFIDIVCTEKERDSNGLELSVKIKDQNLANLVALKESLTLNITNPIDKKTQTFSLQKDGQVFSFQSEIKSKDGCPIKSNYQIEGAKEPSKYAINYKTEQLPTNPFIVTTCERAEIPTDEDGFGDYMQSDKYYLHVTAYEDEYKLNKQRFKVAKTLTFNNLPGVSATFAPNDTEILVKLTPKQFENCTNITPSNYVNPPFTAPGSPNPNTFVSVMISELFDNEAIACKADINKEAFSPTLPLKVKERLFKSKAPVEGISDGKYATKQGEIIKWFITKNGYIDQMGDCIEKPYIQQDCKNIISNLNAPNTIGLTFKFLKSKSSSLLYRPTENIQIILTNGEQINIKPEEINSNGEVVKTLSFESCQGIKSVYPAKYDYDITAYDCTTLPSAPTLFATNSTPSFGEEVTITAAGCSGGKIIWTGYNITDNQLKVIAEPNVKYIARCQLNGCLSEEVSISLNTKSVEITSNQPSNTACAGRETILTATGCSKTAIWTLPNQSETLNGLTISVNPLVTSIYKYNCVAKTGRSTSSPEFTLTVNKTPNQPSIVTDIPLGQGNAICKGNTFNLLTAVGCSLGETINWSTNTLRNISPLVNSNYYATCQLANCISDQSNIVAVEIIDPPSPIISNNITLQTVVKGTTLTFEAKGCKVGQTVEWSNGQTGSPINITLNNVGSFGISALCKDRFCAINSSEIFNVNVLNDIPTPSLVATKATMCSYENSTLTASNCALGNIEWLKAGEANWQQIGADVRSLSVNHSAGSFQYKVRCNLNGFTTEAAAVNLFVNAEPNAPMLSSNKTNNTICNGESITLIGDINSSNANASNHLVEWLNLNGSTINPTQTGSYYAITKNTNTGCQTQSDRKSEIKIIVNPIPSIPTIFASIGSKGANSAEICEYEKTNISGIGSGLIWKIDGIEKYNLGNTIANINTENTFEVKSDVLGCHSNYSQPFMVSIKNRPTKPTISLTENSICSGDGKTIGIAANDIQSGASINWQDGSTEANRIFSAVGKYSNFTVKSILNGCESEVSESKSFEIKQTPAIPTIGSSNGWSICNYSLTNISVTNQETNTSIVWVNNNSLTNVAIGGNYAAYSLSNNGCKSNTSVEKSLIVKTRPSSPSITVSATSICTGKDNSITISATGCPVGASIQWHDGNTDFNRTFTSAGNYTKYKAKCILNDCESYESDAVSFEIKQTPEKPTVNNATICAGNTATISANGCSGTYNWTSLNSNTQSQSISNLSAGTYSYKVLCNSNGCNSTETEASVIVNALPSVSASAEQTICQGNSVGISASHNNIGNLIWDNDAGTNAYATVSPNNTTTYTITANNNGCVASDKVTINVNAKPSAPSMSPNTTTCNSTLITASCATGFASWDNTSIGNSSNISKNVNTAGTYYAYCNSNDCWGDANSTTVSMASPSTPVVTKNTESCGSIIWEAGCTVGTPSWRRVDWNAIGQMYTVETYNSASLNFNSGFNGLQRRDLRVSCSLSGCSNEIDPGDIPQVKATPNAPSLPFQLTICKGSSATINATGCTGTVIWENWSLNGLSGNNTSVTPSTTSYYRAKCANEVCESVFSNYCEVKVIEPVNTPTITASASNFCNTESITLTAADGNGTYKWNTYGEPTGNQITVSSGGTYTVIVSPSNNICPSKSQSISVDYLKADKISIERSFPENATRYLRVNNCTGSIKWTVNDKPVPVTDTYINVDYYGPGRYEVICTNACGTVSTTDYIDN